MITLDRLELLKLAEEKAEENKEVNAARHNELIRFTNYCRCVHASFVRLDVETDRDLLSLLDIRIPGSLTYKAQQEK